MDKFLKKYRETRSIVRCPGSGRPTIEGHALVSVYKRPIIAGVQILIVSSILTQKHTNSGTYGFYRGKEF